MDLVAWGDRWCLGGGSAWAWVVPWWPVLGLWPVCWVVVVIGGLGGVLAWVA